MTTNMRFRKEQKQTGRFNDYRRAAGGYQAPVRPSGRESYADDNNNKTNACHVDGVQPAAARFPRFLVAPQQPTGVWRLAVPSRHSVTGSRSRDPAWPIRVVPGPVTVADNVLHTISRARFDPAIATSNIM